MTTCAGRLNALADELQAATTAPQTADAAVPSQYTESYLRLLKHNRISERLDQEVLAMRLFAARNHRARWLDDFAHGIYVMEMRWAYMPARQWKHHVGVAKGAA